MLSPRSSRVLGLPQPADPSPEPLEPSGSLRTPRVWRLFFASGLGLGAVALVLAGTIGESFRAPAATPPDVRAWVLPWALAPGAPLQRETPPERTPFRLEQTWDVQVAGGWEHYRSALLERVPPGFEPHPTDALALRLVRRGEGDVESLTAEPHGSFDPLLVRIRYHAIAW